MTLAAGSAAPGRGASASARSTEGALRRAILALLRVVARVYFRKISVVGDVPRGATGRVLLPNHVNGLVDPLLVLTTAETRVAPISKAPLWKIPILGALLDALGAVPVVRRRDDPTKAGGANDELFKTVGHHLARGGNILIFPEGTSHNEPGLVKLRTGPARMMLWGEGVAPATISFQAVGLEFEARDVFRSRVLVFYGPARTFASVAPASLSDEERVQAVTRVIEEDLSRMLVTADNWEERRLTEQVAELLAHEAGETSFEGFAELARAVRDAGGALRLHAPALVDPVKERTAAYFAVLEREGLSDQDVTSTNVPLRAGRVAPWLMLLLLPLATLGFFLYALPYRIPRWVSARAGGEGDLVSTLKLVAGLVVFPLWACSWSVAFAFVLPGMWPLLAIFLVWTTPVPALWWLDALEDGSLERRPSRHDVVALRRAAVSAIEEARVALLAAKAV